MVVAGHWKSAAGEERLGATASRGATRDRLLTQGHQGRGGYRMAESRRMTKSELFTHFAERFGIKRAEAGEFFDELQQLTEQELLRCGEFVLPGGREAGGAAA